MAVQLDSLTTVFHQLSDYIYLTCPGLDAADWVVELSQNGEECNSKYLEVRVRAKREETRVTELLLRKMMLRVVTESGELVEECTLHSKVMSSTGMDLFKP